jgi:hypothetical protein
VHLGALSLERGTKYVVSLLLVVPSIPIVLLHALGCVRGERRAVLGPALAVVLGGFAYLIVYVDDLVDERLAGPHRRSSSAHRSLTGRSCRSTRPTPRRCPA